ncbi:hypothetical protein BJ508DRAFT_417195 [Ascobolus immersus RN42]|uniref:Uncharacterized protein n=1 Tax=Ascobolus immersus RN42 TaxID=1160509 RepID=A0A3N4HTX6_ASCIM|nr:hypothetical protein BJ508DRAFT_417195 [Ascobolus immersus RN42]
MQTNQSVYTAEVTKVCKIIPTNNLNEAIEKVKKLELEVEGDAETERDPMQESTAQSKKRRKRAQGKEKEGKKEIANYKPL